MAGLYCPPPIILTRRNNWMEKGGQIFCPHHLFRLRGRNQRRKFKMINTGYSGYFPEKVLLRSRRCRRKENWGNNCGEDLEGRQVHQWGGGERCEKMFYSSPPLLHLTCAPPLHIFLHVHPPPAYLLCTFSRLHPLGAVGWCFTQFHTTCGNAPPQYCDEGFLKMFHSSCKDNILNN